MSVKLLVIRATKGIPLSPYSWLEEEEEEENS